MKTRNLVLLAACIGLFMGGCAKKKEDADKKDEPAKIDDMKAGANANAREQARPAESDQLTVAKYKELWLKLASCKLTKWGIDSKCPAYKDLVAARKNKKREKDFWKKLKPVSRELITNPSPPVRYWAASSMDSFFGANVEKSNFILEKAKKEKHPLVLKKMIAVVGSSAKKNPKVAEFLLAMADHADEKVRMETVGWLASSWTKDVKGALEKVVEKIEKDPSVKVRAYACRQSYRHENEKMLAIYVKYTKDPTKLPELADGCARGMFDMWNAFIHMQNPSQKAYKLTMKLVSKKPRTDKWPPWTIMSSFGRMPKQVMPDRTKVVPKWYSQKAVVKLMVDVAGDKNYNWLGRVGAVRALGKLGAVKELEKLKKKVTASKDDKNKTHVLRRIDEVAKKAATGAPPAGGAGKPAMKGKGKVKK